MKINWVGELIILGAFIGLIAVIANGCMTSDQSTTTEIQQLNATIAVYGTDIPASLIGVASTSSGHRQTKEVSPGRELSPARAATVSDNVVPINQGPQTNSAGKTAPSPESIAAGPAAGADPDGDVTADNDPPAAPQ